MGDAKKSYRLMLADVVCNCFRGRITTLKSEQKQRIKTICTDKKIFEFKSQENEIWKEIKNSLLKYNIADAVYDWYMYLNENEKDLKKEFYNLLLTTINKIDSKLLEIQYAIIGQRIRTLVDSRKFIVAEEFCENLLKEYFNANAPFRLNGYRQIKYLLGHIGYESTYCFVNNNVLNKKMRGFHLFGSVCRKKI